MTELRSATFTIAVDGKEKGTSIVTLTKNVKDLDAIEQKLNATLGENVKVTTSQATTQKSANTQARAAIREYNKQQKAIRDVTTYYKQQTIAAKMTADQQEVFNAQMRAGVEPMSEQGRAIEKLVTQYQQLRSTGDAGRDSMRNMRGVAQNLGWQLQDTAVQLQMGTSALVVFSQQGSQMASAFGPTGALIGALIAVGGALAGVAASAAEASSELEDLIEKEKELLNEPTKKQNQVTLLTEQIKQAEQEIERLQKGVIKVTQTGYGASDVDISYGAVDAEKVEETNKLIEAQFSLIRKLKLEIADLTGAAYGSDALWSQAGVITVEEIEAENALILAEKDEFNAKALAADQQAANDMIALRKAALKQQEQDEKEALRRQEELNAEAMLADQIAFAEMERLRKEHNKRMAELESGVNKIAGSVMSPEDRLLAQVQSEQAILAEAYQNKLIDQQEFEQLSLASMQKYVQAMNDQSVNMTLNQMGVWSQFLGGLENTMSSVAALADESSAEGKALFLATQAIAVANTLVNAHMAATQAMADPSNPTMIGKIAAADAMLALGYANAGIIAGTAIAGAFDQGGYIPNGMAGIVSEYGDELVNGTLVKGPATVTSRKDTADMMNGGNTTVIQQNITVSGNGDKALTDAMALAAKRGAEEGYAKVSKDFITGRGIRKVLKQSIGG